MSPLQPQPALAIDSDRDTLSRKSMTASIITILIYTSACIHNSPSALYLAGIIFVPTLLALRYRKRLSSTQNGDLTTIAWTYLFMTTLSIPVVMLIQLIFALGSAHLCFGNDAAWFLNEFQNVSKESDIRDDDHRAMRVAFIRRPRYWGFLLLATFVLVGISEELQKYVALRLARWLRKDRASPAELVVYGGVVGLAYASFEGLMFVVNAQKDSSQRLVFEVVARLTLGMAGHILCGLSTAMEMAKRGRQGSRGLAGGCRVIARSTLFHGLGNFGLAGYSALRGHVGFLNPEEWHDIGACFAISAMASTSLAVLLWRDLKKLKMD